MNINYHISPYPALHENMIAIVYEVDVSGGISEVDRLVLLEKNSSGVPTVGAGHQVPESVSFNGLDKLTHEIRLYSNSGTLLHKYQVQPTDNLITIFDPIKFKIGDGGTHTPAAGSSTFIHPDLAGLTPAQYNAQRNGVGVLFEGVHIADNGSGFDLFQPGDTWSTEDEVLITRTNQVVSNIVNDSVVGKQFGPTIGNSNIYADISSSVAYNPTLHLRKLIRLSGPAAEFHFGTGVSVPVGYPFRFTNVGAYGALTDMPTIHFDSAQLIEGNTHVSVFQMPVGSVCEFVFDGTYFNKTILFVADPNPVASFNIVGRGIFNVGDVPGAASEYTITHGLSITGDYAVWLSVQSNNSSDHSKDLTLAAPVWWHDVSNKPNRFKIGLRETTGVVQNIAIAWMIVKL